MYMIHDKQGNCKRIVGEKASNVSRKGCVRGAGGEGLVRGRPEEAAGLVMRTGGNRGNVDCIPVPGRLSEMTGLWSCGLIHGAESTMDRGREHRLQAAEPRRILLEMAVYARCCVDFLACTLPLP